MQAKVTDGIKLVGYANPAFDVEFDKIIEEGPKSAHYTHLVSFITNELRSLCGIDEQVNAITCPDDSVSFLMELSSFLKEIGCPYECLMQGHMSDRLITMEDKLLLLDYLLTELMTSRMLREKVPEKKIELKLNETPNAANLRKILSTLGFPKPPLNITFKQLFQKLIPSVETAIKKGGQELLGNPICNFKLTEKQWNTLSTLQKDLHNEYTIRREMMLKRLDCTIQSFQWSDKTKGKEAQINMKYTEKRQQLRVVPDVSLSDLMSAREDLAIIEKTSSAAVRKNTKSSVNQVIIGQVPDRGGRTSEQAPPPPEMPSWQQRSAGPQGGRGGGGGRGGNFRGGGGGDRGGDRGGGRGGGYHASGDGRGGRPQSNYNNYNNNQRGGTQVNFDSAGSYGGNSGYNDNRVSSSNTNYTNKDYTYAGNYDITQNKSQGSYSDKNYASNSHYSQPQNDRNNQSNSSTYSGNYDSPGRGRYNSGGFDSAGSYGGYQHHQQDHQPDQAKRAKTSNYFQSHKQTYADQYVQESQHNQQYQSREYNRGGNSGARGRSSYHRGNNRSYN